MVVHKKENVDEIQIEKALGKWHECLANRHREFAETLHLMDIDLKKILTKKRNVWKIVRLIFRVNLCQKMKIAYYNAKLDMKILF